MRHQFYSCYGYYYSIKPLLLWSLVILYTLMIALHTLFSQELSSYKITQYIYTSLYRIIHYNYN